MSEALTERVLVVPAAVFQRLGYFQGFCGNVERYLPELLVGLTGLALLFTLGLTALEVFVIHAVCRYCLISAAIILVMFVLAVSYLRAANRHAPSTEVGPSETPQRIAPKV